MTTNATEIPTYNRIVRETHIVPEHIYPHCASLVQFTWPAPHPPAKRNTAPRPGQKPNRKKARS